MVDNKYTLKNYNWWRNIDKLILISTLLLLLFGVISMSSINQHFEKKFLFSPDLLLKKHLIFCIVGLIIIFVLSQFSIKNAIYFSLFMFVLSIVLCLAAIFFFPETKGANRWIKFYNFSFQPSELLKPSFIVLSAVLLGRYKTKNDYSFFLNFLCLMMISSLLILQPDFGMFILIFAVWLIQILSSNINFKIIIPIIVSFVFVFLFCFFTLEHVKFRIMNFFFSEVGDNYQISKSLDSFENGGLFGKGIGEGTIAKNLPDVHSDFIFALIGEELGGFFAILIIGLYVIIYVRIQIISQGSRNFFIVTALTGLANIFIFQVIINSSIIVGFILLLIKEEKNAK